MFLSSYTHFGCDAAEYTGGDYKGATFIALNYATNFKVKEGVLDKDGNVKEEDDKKEEDSSDDLTVVESELDYASFVAMSSLSTGLLLT